ncbi:Csu type fimbrial protein [Lysobacter arvi]|uniref:Spore coat protein U domain-containing protein n=1 Tax=Lysobacter arvi TaxID=3038776 RepID=A0ABU1CAW3_9GAMM|nr:spore coat protein U domain-containing protein [Lysobacter arvi]MDR0182338.1 spore coat protein U domain-containing protein [Lysobacter arvi]
MRRGSVLFLPLTWLAFSTASAQTCTFSLANADFGNVDVLVPGAIDAVAQGTFSCTGASTPYVRACVSAGSGRYMTGPASAKLSYDMYIDAARTRPWGSLWEASAANVLTADIPIASGSGSATVPVYLRIFDGQAQSPVGSYSQGFLGAGYTGYNAVGYSTTPPTCTTSSGPQTAPSFTIRATVIAGCSVSATSIDFGQMGVIAAPINATGVITATCTKGAIVTLALNAGTGSGATVASRRMTRAGGSELLTYMLYADSARTQLWGDKSSGTTTVGLSGTGAAQTVTVYGTVPAQTTPKPGTYSDTVTVTVTF